ncbi:GNAT family N-acetyltransferase [Mycobacterium vicinigordonae]|uniref:GNAT family N-acetyltransferase n=1 Tax=Mycobacterium vicinigordonae TaxID=1719132 RepID=UPI001FE4D854|nr:GNAT family N-acetyltransferase [Mycobacterium vicinigordonae]
MYDLRGAGRRHRVATRVGIADLAEATGVEVQDLEQRCARIVAPGTTYRSFSLQRVQADRDLELVHTWMNDPVVARFWGKPWPRDRIADYLAEQDRSAISKPYLGVLDGVPMSYWELYRADLDPLADHYPARDHDAGVHLLLGPPSYRGRGLGVLLLRTVSGWQFDADPRATRAIAEPDIANVRSIRAFERAGFRRDAEMALPNKRAALMIRDRHHSTGPVSGSGRRIGTPPEGPTELC